MLCVYRDMVPGIVVCVKYISSYLSSVLNSVVESGSPAIPTSSIVCPPR